MSEELVHLRKFLTGIVANAPFGIVTLSENHEVGLINGNAVEYLGLGQTHAKDWIDKRYDALFENLSKVSEIITSHIGHTSPLIENLSHIQVGERILNIKIRSMLTGKLIIIEDITLQAELEDLLRIQATHDALTSLSNRHAFEKRGNSAINKAITHNLPGAIIFIDLDRFKPVNDTAGHAAGDLLLKNIAGILQHNTRQRDMVARLGGDEFAILLEDCPIEKAVEIAEKIRDQIERYDFLYDNKIYTVTLSAGICAFGNPEDTLSTIVNAADNACQIAKQSGRNSIHVADELMEEYSKHQSEANWLPRINDAIANNHFILFSQKITPLLDTLEPHHEILIRFKEENNQFVSPNLFIPAAERYNLMIDIDHWVLEEAFKTMNKNERYSINISGQSLKSTELAFFISDLFEKYRINPERITLEITETAAIQNIGECIAFMQILKKKGVKFSLDDFGSGLSSFNYLKTLPVNYLKIDAGLIKDIAESEVSFAMVKSINQIAHSMRLETIAEGVETEAMLSRLKDIGVDYVQGFLFDKPHILASVEAA